jgi:hypothetical protein
MCFMNTRLALPALLIAASILPCVASAGQIANIGIFLSQCPDRDPAYAQIVHDFELRKDGVLVSEPVCTEPTAAIPTAQYTDALITRQGLRVIYYMDRGQTGHLPWTSGTLYDWMKSKIGGINIVTGGSSSCCVFFGGKTFINVGSENDSNRDFDRTWPGIAGNIDLYAHETRHVDGFPHSSCCGIANGCDNTFDVANLSPYGVQWWLNHLWLSGGINVGYECLIPADVVAATNWFSSSLNSQFRTRFCTNLPAVEATPAVPGGACPPQPRRRSAKH